MLYDAALIDLASVPRERANALLRCRWENGEVVGTLVKGTSAFCAAHGFTPGSNPGVTCCTRVTKEIAGETNVVWFAAWTWRPENEKNFSIKSHVAAHDWVKVEDGVYGGTLRNG